jgi:hypothetical protein
VLDERRTWFGRATDAIFISHFFPLQFTHGSVERDIPDDQARDALRMSRRAALVSYAVGAVVLPFNPLLGGTFLAMGKSIDVGVARGAMRALPPAP